MQVAHGRGYAHAGPNDVRRPMGVPAGAGRAARRDRAGNAAASERVDTALRQFHLAAQDKGEYIACLEARKHFAWYLRGVAHSGYYKEKISAISSMEEIEQIASGIKRDLR